MSDKKPLYMQVIDKLRERIKSGDFEYDVPFVTEDRITKEFGVSRITAIRALEELEKAGIINRKRGSGSFVSREAVDIIEGRSVSDIRTNSENKDREVLLVALVLPFDIKLGNMFKCFDGINSVLNKENCFASIYNANRDVETEASILRSLLNQGIDGVICYPVNGTKNFEVYNQFLAKKIPLVIIDNYIENMPVSYVASDNFGGTKMLCEYAISKGHKKIGFFSKRRINESLSIRDRYMGYTSALAENIEVNLDYVCVDLDDKYNMLNETEAARYDSLRAYIAEIIGQMRAEGVTCILCQNDWVAVELYSVCEELGISVPDDMCIMGFDNMDELNNMHGGDKIITVEQDFYEIGVRAGETILKEIRGEEKGIRDVVPVKLITRDY